MASNSKTFETAAKRWEGIGPYYAMFPTRFADAVVKRHTDVGDTVLDPFAGRGTSIFSAAANERIGYGIEISPVGWIYANTKLHPATEEHVEARLCQVWKVASRFSQQARALPKFFHSAFSRDVRQFLMAARSNLNWRGSRVDQTLMAFLLVYLHGKLGQALSNQMRQTKAFSPTYAVAWWADRGMRPPDIDPVEFLRQRIQWRYAKGVIENGHCRVYFGDSTRLLPKVLQGQREERVSKARLLLTSPPYFGVTNYYYDQWLRLWLLGSSPRAYISRGKHRGRFANREDYSSLLETVFLKASKALRRDAVVYVRTSNDKATLNMTCKALAKAFPRKSVRTRRRPFNKPTQTHLFGDKSPKPGEIDIILTS